MEQKNNALKGFDQLLNSFTTVEIKTTIGQKS